jgi:hypothetical protein
MLGTYLWEGCKPSEFYMDKFVKAVYPRSRSSTAVKFVQDESKRLDSLIFKTICQACSLDKIGAYLAKVSSITRDSLHTVVK